MGAVPHNMYIGEFEDIVRRNNATAMGIRFISHSSRSNAGAPANTCTMLVGAWLPVVKTDDPSAPEVHRDHITAINVAVPQIPEHTVYDLATGRIVARGWKGLLQVLLADRVIRPSKEIRDLCGEHWDAIRLGAEIRCF